MKWKLYILLIVLFALGIFGAYYYVKTHGFSARVKPNAVETYLARKIRRLVVPHDVKTLVNPLKPTPILIAEGRDHFADHCALCHANDGSGKTKLGQWMYPPCPDMRHDDTQGLTDGELFYIIKEGIRFSGMPGWGGDDEENWKLVLFIRHLPELTEEELGYMKEINSLELNR